MLPTNIGESGMVRTSRTQVIGLSEHRSRRRQRLSLARAMQSGDPVRAALVRHLSDLAEVTGADRAAAVWIDEYGEGRVHPYVTLDLLSDRPRRSFPLEPLERAWEIGLPGVFEGSGDGFRRLGDGSYLFAVALGSDGARAWFVVCDSVGPRPRLSVDERQRMLFLAGECSAALLHQDLDQGYAHSPRGREGAGFVGRPVLEDLDEHDDRPDVSAKIGQRFMLVRLARALLDEYGSQAPSPEWADRVGRTRAEMAKASLGTGHAGGGLDSLLDAMEGQRYAEVADLLVTAGAEAEAEGHIHGALELYRCAFDAAATVMYPEAAVDAARFRGRVERRFARWNESLRAYEVAHEIAMAGELWERAVSVLAGMASVRQENGNLPAARTGYERALDLALQAGGKNAIAVVHHGLLGLEHAAGNTSTALGHGWQAVANYEEAAGRIRCVASLAGALVDYGDLVAAEDAWAIVARDSAEIYYRTYAHDALAYLAAVRGDLGEFERQAGLCDALDWESGPRSAKAEILYYRGLSYRALGLHDAGERWLGRAVRYAEEFSLNRTLFRAEEALRALEKERSDQALEPVYEENTAPSAPDEICEGLREMRRDAGGVVA